ncbi:MAG: helix-turn-helix transcriptional regulator [Bacteroidetes bacterium]|nr:helix-turn-helix transcriptional regulator [Bacteroidota bacterium]
MLKRIFQLIKSKEITASEFASTIGVQPSSVSHVLSGRNKPSLDFVLKILRCFPEINPDWLLFDHGAMIRKEKITINNQEIRTGHIETFKSETGLKVSPVEEGKTLLQDSTSPVKSDTQVAQNTGVIKSVRIVIFFNDHTFSEYMPENVGK